MAKALTKALFRLRFERLRSLMGLITRYELEWECWNANPKLLYRLLLRILLELPLSITTWQQFVVNPCVTV